MEPTYPSTENETIYNTIMKTPWSIKNQEECIYSLGSSAYPTDIGVFCNATWDTILCWPATRAGSTVKLPCPPLPGLDPEKYGFRTCGPEGLWEGKEAGDYSLPRGYTNYTDCYLPETLELYKRFFSEKTPAQKQLLKDVITGTRTMDVVGLWLSLVSSLLSLFIFSYFRSLRCHRTRIHRNLFVSIIVQVFIRLIVYVDQYVARLNGGEVGGTPSGMTGTIYDTPVLCEVLYTLLEYTKTVQFMWMLIEGMYLHNQIAVSVFSKKPNYQIFYAMGWGAPLPITIAWCITMAITFDRKCWYLYYFLPYIWIIEAPRVAIIVVNLLFLLNIIRVLVLKLQDTRHTNEAQYVKVRKAIKAALFLLPLLGITNFAVMIKSPTEPITFAVWSYTSHFLTSFQGFIISLLYCFLNGEVQVTLRRHFCITTPMNSEVSRNSMIRVYPNIQQDLHLLVPHVQHTLKKRWDRLQQRHMVHNSSFRRMSRSLSVFTSVTEVPHTSHQNRTPGAVSSSHAGNNVPLLRNAAPNKKQESGL